MPDSLTLLQKALALHQSGQLDQAERLYGDVLSREPENPDALHLLGLAHHQRGDDRAALAPLERAVAASPDTALYHNSLGEVFRRLGDPDKAEAQFRNAVRLAPGYSEAHNNLGNLLRDRGDLAGARAALSRAVTLKPGSADAWNNLGVTLFEAGRTADAVEAYHKSIALNPGEARVHNNLGNALRHRGDLAAAERSIAKALALRPDYGEALSNLGAVYQRQRRLDDAIAHYRKALAVSPASATAHNNLAAALYERGEIKDAVATAERAIALDPTLAEAHNTLGNALIQMGRNQAAVDAYERSCRLKPEFDTAYFNLVSHLPVIGDWPRLERYLPEMAGRVKALLAKGDAEACSALIPASFTLPYFSTDHVLHKAVLTGVARYVAGVAAAIDTVPATEPRPDKKPIAIGYLSPDFGDHPISHVTLPVYRLHDRDRFTVHAFSLLDRDDPDPSYRRAIENSADHFHDLSAMSLAEAAEAIRAANIDILVDLSGYMRFGRPQILALRPAPVQVYWLGHGGGLGAPYIDYVIGDPTLTPPDEDDRYVERIARLPDTFSSADRPAISETAARRADHGLPEKAPDSTPGAGFVFCGFNNALKLEPETVRAWLTILAAVPGSVLWLSAGSDPTLRRNLRRFADDAGIDPARLVFAERLPDKGDHLARHGLADLFLDSFKFNASTTALDALWAGLPLLTREGPTFHSRIGASYLRALGLDDLITADTESFIAMAVALATQPERLADFRTTLIDRRETAPLFDGARFVRNLEAAYAHMFARAAAGEAAAGFNVGYSETGPFIVDE